MEMGHDWEDGRVMEMGHDWEDGRVMETGHDWEDGRVERNGFCWDVTGLRSLDCVGRNKTKTTQRNKLINKRSHTQNAPRGNQTRYSSAPKDFVLDEKLTK